MDDLFRVRTSETDPLMIDEVQLPDHLEGCALGITFCPGKTETTPTGNWARDLQADLAVIRDWAPDFVVLTFGPSEAEALCVDGLESAMSDAGIRATTRQDAWCDWPAPKSADRRVIDTLPRLFRRHARVLLIGRNGGARSGNLASEILMRDAGMQRLDEAIGAVNSARPHAVDTASQRDYLAHHWDRRRLPGPAQDPAAPAVTAAKARAARLRRMMAEDGQPISLSASLERVAMLEGHRDWNSYRASLVATASHRSGCSIALSGASSGLELEAFLRWSLHLREMNRSNAESLETFREMHNLSGPETGFSQVRHRSVALGVHEGVRSLFGPDAPDYLRRLHRAYHLSNRLDPRFLQSERYRRAEDIPRNILEEMAEDPGYLELLILHEAGYGTPRGLDAMRSSSHVLFKFDLQAAINGDNFCSDMGREQFFFASIGSVLALEYALS